MYPIFKLLEHSRSSTKEGSSTSPPTCSSIHRSPGMFEPTNFEFSLSVQSSTTSYSARISASQPSMAYPASQSRTLISLQTQRTVSLSTLELPFLHLRISVYSSVPLRSRSILWVPRVSLFPTMSSPRRLHSNRFSRPLYSRRRERQRSHTRSFGDYGRSACWRDYSSIRQRTQESRNSLLELLARTEPNSSSYWRRSRLAGAAQLTGRLAFRCI